jgi:acyl-CoA synthetase (NDP forming)
MSIPSPFCCGTAADALLARAESEGRDVLLEPEVYALLADAGVAVPAHAVVARPDDIMGDLCRAIGTADAVVKIVSPDILHKSDVGGVRICPNTPADLRAAAADVMDAAARRRPEARLRGVLVAARVPFRPGLGREILAGVRHDRAFGPVVVLGVGGLDVEFLGQVLRPESARAIMTATGLTPDLAETALRDTLVGAALGTVLRSRDSIPVPPGALARLAVSLARLATRLCDFAPDGGLGLAEMEINPVLVADDGRLVAVDGLGRLHRPAPLPAPRPVGRLRHLLEPRSAAVIGASADAVNAGRIILRNLAAGGGVARDKVFAIHPRAAAIDGCRAVPTPADLPEPVDMAVVSVPSERGADRVVVDLVEGRRARTITLISGGFAETEGGRAAEARIRAAAEASHRDPDGGVLVNGGNCLGIISVPGGYNTFFLPPYKLPFHDAPGQNVASISQSGAYLVSQISNLDRAVRPRYAISFGNQVDVTVSDYLEYLEADPKVEVFAVYLEGFRRGDGARFVDLARRITTAGRTVLLYKAGRTREGTVAAASHTAAIVGDYEVCHRLAVAAGAIDCVTLDMFEDYLMTFSFLARRAAGGRPIPAGRRAPAGRRVAVVSNAGFECTAAADKLYGLELAAFAPATSARLRTLLPAGVIDVHNPIDTTPITPTDLYAGCVETVLDDPGVDAVVVAGVPATPYLESLARGEGHGEDLGRPSSLPSRLIRIFQSTAKPMVFSVDSGPLYEDCVQMMKRAGLPCFRKVDRATRALGAFLAASSSQ